MSELREDPVTVVAAGQGELVARICEATRELVVGTLDAHLAAATDGLVYETAEAGRRRRHRKLAEIAALKHQLDEAAGPVELSGPAGLVSEVVRDTVAQATHDLDSFVEEVTAGLARLGGGEIADLRLKASAAVACIETLIACESSRGQA
jgi:hypothetical protein